MFFSFFYFPEEIGQETINQVDLTGFAFDIHGDPSNIPIKVRLNKPETRYKNQLNVSGEELQTVPDSETGRWSFLVPDNFHMPLDSYYRIDLNGAVYRKFLPDFPPENFLNQLEDY